jgi:hypothetical protein
MTALVSTHQQGARCGPGLNDKPRPSRDLLLVSRAEALFVSDLPARPGMDHADLDGAIRTAVQKFGGSRGCAAAMAFEYGEHPETATARMRWALATVEAAYPRPRRRPRNEAA